MWHHLITALIVSALTMLVAGCTTYYQVTDPASGKSYYTTKVGGVGAAGAVKIKDNKTGNTVTLQSSEVKDISEEEYKAGMMARGPAKPAAQPSAASSQKPAQK